MGRRYYCDYCDRSFIDEKDSRKKHLSGVVHIRMRNEYYANFKDLRSILKEESSKITCKRFLTNSCMFGSSCRFSHYTQEQLYEINKQVEEEAKQKQLKDNISPSLISWLESRVTGKKSDKNSPSIHEKQGVICDIPAELEQELYLPPSLQRPNILNINTNTFPDWGN